MESKEGSHHWSRLERFWVEQDTSEADMPSTGATKRRRTCRHCGGFWFARSPWSLIPFCMRVDHATECRRFTVRSAKVVGGWDRKADALAQSTHPIRQMVCVVLPHTLHVSSNNHFHTLTPPPWDEMSSLFWSVLLSIGSSPLLCLFLKVSCDIRSKTVPT